LILTFLVAFIRWSAMRCGHYIREVIEPHFPLEGWDSWAEKSELPRGPERLLAYAFLILIVLYYIIATVIAMIHIGGFLAKQKFAATGL
jgi:hypothetical protein